MKSYQVGGAVSAKTVFVGSKKALVPPSAASGTEALLANMPLHSWLEKVGS
jgi:hypothetical protein